MQSILEMAWFPIFAMLVVMGFIVWAFRRGHGKSGTRLANRNFLIAPDPERNARQDQG